jgi:hypothetical protein
LSEVVEAVNLEDAPVGPAEGGASRLRRLAWPSVAVAAILLLAAWLRLRHLGLAEYSDDQAIALRIAHDILHGDIRTVGLASSSGAANPPLYVYMAAGIVAIHDSLVFASATVAIASVIAVALAYVVVRPRFGGAVALVTALLFATAPWAVLFGRHFWQQDYLPLAATGLLWSAFVVLERDRTHVVALVPVLFAITFQLNLSSIALVVPLAALLAYRARHVDWRAFVAGVGIAVLSLSLWLAHVAKHGFHDLGLVFANGRGHHGGTVGGGAVEAFRLTLDLVGAGGWSIETGASHQGGAGWTLGRAAGVVVVVLLFVGTVTAIARVVRERPSPSIDTQRRALLVVWVVGVCLMYLPSRQSGVAPHYLLISYPATFLLAALGLRDLASLAGRPADAVSAGVAVCLAAAFVGFSLSFQEYVQDNGGARGSYDVAYNESAALAAAARARHLHIAYARAEYLAWGHLNVPDGTPASQVVSVRDRLHDGSPLPCSGKKESFGPLEACFPS